MFETSRLELVGYAARRSVVMARQGMVASSQPLAVEAGVGILKKGRNAIDAAIAEALILGVVEPVSTGIGGVAELRLHVLLGQARELAEASPYQARRGPPPHALWAPRLSMTRRMSARWSSPRGYQPC